MKQNKFVAVLAVIFVLFFASLAILMQSGNLTNFDKAITQFILKIKSETMTDWMIILTHASSKLVNVIIFLLACLILFVVTRRITGPAVLAFTLGGVSVLNWVLKTWLQRARPDVLHEVQVSGYSFPSGHAMLSAAFFGMLGYIIWSALKRRHSAMAWPALIIVYALILIIGISRIYLQVHFPSDVIAGYAAGFFWLILSIKVWQAVHEKQEHSQRVRLDLR